MDRFFYFMQNLHSGCAEAIKRVTSATHNYIPQKTLSKNIINMSLCVNSVLLKNG